MPVELLWSDGMISYDSGVKSAVAHEAANYSRNLLSIRECLHCSKIRGPMAHPPIPGKKNALVTVVLSKPPYCAGVDRFAAL